MNATKGNTFGAPWGWALKVITGSVALWSLVMIIIGIAVPARTPAGARLAMILGPIVLIAATVPFAVRGYTIANGEIDIERVGWSTHVSLDALKSATVEPNAMAWWSIRLFGDGGLFAFAGWFWNPRLRKFRAFATDPQRSVVLRFADRTVVITPDEPERFVEEIRRRIID